MNKMNSKDLKRAIISASNSMVNNKNRIDAMNVFPVPDGDTGSNMGSTVEFACEEIRNTDFDSVGKLMSKFARGMLMGARGNSGVILSQIFKGFAVSLEGKKEASTFDFVDAFKQASEYAYKSVMKPVEGTILTVIRLISEKLSSTITANSTINDLFELATSSGKEACEKTPDFLPVLKEVGVTDSGGEGLLMILIGIDSFLKGKPIELTEQEKADTSTQFLKSGEEFNGEFGYCTEFIVELKSPKSFKLDRFKVGIEKLGDSVVSIVDGDILKTHIHVKKPGFVLNYAQKFGDFMKLKIDNMTIQANESKKAKDNAFKDVGDASNNESLNVGVISCNTGTGIIEDMRELGANFIIEAGQTANPSAKDFIEAIEKLNTDRIIILPNNSNIILAAQQVTQTTKKEVVVIPTKSQMQGLVAMMNFNREGKLIEIQEDMNESLSDVKTGQITVSGRTTKIGGVSVKKDEFLAIADRKILSSTRTKTQAAIAVCKKLINDETEIVTIYYGQDATESDAEEVSSYIETHYDADVEIKNGAQPTYNFLMAFE